jgi:hypothetical protein
MKTFNAKLEITVSIDLSNLEAESVEDLQGKLFAKYESTQDRFGLVRDNIHNRELYLDVKEIEETGEIE